jgi:hypothetical protein
MRIIDADRKHSARCLQLYLTVKEALELRVHLDRLLADPEANEHFHLFSDDASREISCSIVTPRKLAHGSYTDFERGVFDEK